MAKIGKTSSAGSLRTGEAAAAAGVNIQTLHYYERRGILSTPPRTPAGYRAYSPDDVQMIRAIKRAQNLGFTLREIEELVRVRQGEAPGVDLLALATSKLAEIDAKLRDLRSVRRSLGQVVESCECGGELARCDVLAGLGATALAPLT